MAVEVFSPVRRRIADQFEQVAWRHDDPEVYGGPAGDPGLLGPDSVSWRIHADLATVALAGTAAIILEILHPSVIAGVQDRSSYQRDPARRARTTLGYVLATTFGNTAAATATIEHVKRMHGRVNGTRPDGVPYAALDPELIAWVHTCIPWMVMRSHERFRGPLSPADRDRYLAEQAVIGRMGGADAVPESAAELDEFITVMRPKLAVNAQTRDFVDFVLRSPLNPPLPSARAERALASFQVHAYLTLAPEWARVLVGLHRPHPLAAPLIGPALQADAAVLRWGLQTPAFLRLARERVGAGEVAELRGAETRAPAARERRRSAVPRPGQAAS